MFKKILQKIRSVFPLTQVDKGDIVSESKQNHSMQTQTDPVNHVRDWAIDKIEKLHDADRHKNARALLAEFEEWIDLPEGVDEIEYLCVEECIDS